MIPALLFVGHRLNPAPPISLKIATVMVLGAAVGYHATEMDTGIAATGDNFVGHLRQEVVTSLPLADDVFAGHYTRPALAGYEVVADLWDEFTVEGAGFVLQTGTGTLAANTAKGTLLNLATGGILRVGQTGDICTHEVLTASAGIVSGSDFRIMVRRLPSQVRKP